MSPAETSDNLVVGKTKAVLINASTTAPVKIFNGHGGKLFYKTTAAVSISDTEIAVGSSVTATQIVWIISESQSKVTLEHQVVSNPSAGVGTPSAVPGFYTWQPTTAETGTDTAFAEKKLFTASIFLPVNKTITGVGYLLGGGGGTNKVIAALFDSTGRKVANSSETTEGTVAGTEKTVQELAFTTPYLATGPGVYFIGITANGATAKLRTIPANTAGKNIFTAEVSLTTKNVIPATITAPTEWVAAKGPVAFVF